MANNRGATVAQQRDCAGAAFNSPKDPAQQRTSKTSRTPVRWQKLERRPTNPTKRCWRMRTRMDNQPSVRYQLKDDESGNAAAYRSWAMQTYGDCTKTKTITKGKRDKILEVLNGKDCENSKFRFWVRSKGFYVMHKSSLTNGPQARDAQQSLLYVPLKGPFGDVHYKSVAVVEEFYDIIYTMHMNMVGRSGKHAGQKKTFKAIVDTYAFLPREAVTKFLMSCCGCRRKSYPYSVSDIATATWPCCSHSDENAIDKEDSCGEISMSSSDCETTASGSGGAEGRLKAAAGSAAAAGAAASATPSTSTAVAASSQSSSTEKRGSAQDSAGEAGASATAAPAAGPQKESAPATEVVEAERKVLDRKRKMSDSDSPCSSSPNKEAYADDKDDDDDEDLDDDDKSPPAPDVDPERLKAFNMFVRLFVDENLDRMVPISKQPKDKIQAILDACDRQFPEYHDRSRKRVRTYLKSCRRMRRAKEMNGWDSFRPTPPHLTSAVAESILAQACDNESQNAKRMRMGLEPLPANAAVAANIAGAACLPPAPQPPFQPQQLAKALPGALAPQPPASAVAAAAAAARLFTDWRYPHPAQAFRPDLPHFFGNGLFRPPFLPPYASHVPQSMQHPQLPPTQLQNGPADLSVKKSVSSSGKSPLNPTEIATIRQLIAGYRESAAFLYRSADELEQLLMQQN